MSSLKTTADQIWAALNVSSINDEFNQEESMMRHTQNTCTWHPCGTGYCQTVQASNCCFTPD